MVNATLEINTTRDIAHQIVRHRSFRFKSLVNVMLIQKNMAICLSIAEARLQDPKNRQNSVEVDDAKLQL